ncbi:MAG: sulfur carrier protein ThiS [Alphaproteobacteria bacterium]
MHIKINGKLHELPSPLNISELLIHLQVEKGQVAVERNREIVPRSTHANVMVAEGDEIEIVRFIGGG